MRNAIGLLMVSNKSNAANVSDGKLGGAFTKAGTPKMDYCGSAKSATVKPPVSIVSGGWL